MQAVNRERKSTGQRLVLSKRSALPVTVVQDNWKREEKIPIL